MIAPWYEAAADAVLVAGCLEGRCPRDRATAVRRARRRGMETSQGSKSRFSRFISRVKEQIIAMGNAIDQFFIPDAYYGPVELKMAA